MKENETCLFIDKEHEDTLKLIEQYKSENFYDAVKKAALSITHWAKFRRYAKNIWGDKYLPHLPIHITYNQSGDGKDISPMFYSENIPPLVICNKCKAVTIYKGKENSQIHCESEMELL